MRQNLETIEMDEVDFAQQGANSNYEEIIKIPESQIAPQDIPSSLPSKYVFNESSNSLYIYRQDSREVELVLSEEDFNWKDLRSKYSREYPLLAKKDVIKYIAGKLVSGLKTVQVKKKSKIADTPNWIINKVAKRIGKQISVFMDKQLEKLDPRFVAFHKAVMRFYGFKSYLNLCSSSIGRVDYSFFLKNSHFVNDCIKNPLATAVISGGVVGLFTDLQNTYGSDKWLHYLSNGKPYSYLTKTINNLKPPIPAHLLCNLRNIRLPREFSNKTEFIAFMIAAQYHSFEHHRQTLSFVTEADLKKAFKIMVEKNMIVPRKGQHWNGYAFISRIVYYALDYPEHTNCTFLNLFRRSVDWHEANHGRGQVIGPRNTIARFPMGKELAKPPVALPEIDGITFLATYGDLFNEGNRMNHCVEGYAEPCMTGQSFIFHIDYKGEMATAEIKKDGRISQISGVGNKDNEACKYATKKLLNYVKKSGWLKIEHTKSLTVELENFYDEQPF